jgi:hypothetical protein
MAAQGQLLIALNVQFHTVRAKTTDTPETVRSDITERRRRLLQLWFLLGPSTATFGNFKISGSAE